MVEDFLYKTCKSDLKWYSQVVHLRHGIKPATVLLMEKEHGLRIYEISIQNLKTCDDEFNLICEIQNGAGKCRLCSECTLASFAVSIKFFQFELTLPPNNEECFSCLWSVIGFLVILSVINFFFHWYYPLSLTVQQKIPTQCILETFKTVACWYNDLASNTICKYRKIRFLELLWKQFILGYCNSTRS